MDKEGNSEIVSILKNLTDKMSKMEVAINNRKTEIESIAKNLNMITRRTKTRNPRQATMTQYLKDERICQKKKKKKSNLGIFQYYKTKQSPNKSTLSPPRDAIQ